jgi:hypothetical protein
VCGQAAAAGPAALLLLVPQCRRLLARLGRVPASVASISSKANSNCSSGSLSDFLPNCRRFSFSSKCCNRSF